jgi:hypothetical protein
MFHVPIDRCGRHSTTKVYLFEEGGGGSKGTAPPLVTGFAVFMAESDDLPGMLMLNV